MPRGKKKGNGRRGEAGRQASDEEFLDSGDNMSVVSAMSEGSVAGGLEDDGMDESSSQELFEDKLKDVIDATTAKSAKTRTDAFKSLCGALAKKYIPDFFSNRKLTISDSVERSLKKGKSEEQSWASRCLVLLLLQLGVSPDSEELFSELKPVVLQIMADPSASPKARSACAQALGVASFIASEEIQNIIDAMNSLEKVFSASYLKGDGTVRAHSPDVLQLHTSALGAWSLLLSIVPSSSATGFVDSHLPKMSELLQSQDVELRISAGESIALMYELAREEDEDFEGDNWDTLCATLKQLATDSNKHRAKKERRQQRSSFRDILGTVENGDWPTESIKFNARETLHIEGWVPKIQYDMFALVIGSGMNTHLTENDLIRDIFGFGAPLNFGLPAAKASKVERQLYNAAAFKLRTKIRGKHRDKRVAQMTSD